MDNKIINPICPYCNKESKYVNSSIIYGKDYGMLYLCEDCNAYCGVHKGTNIPLGTLANRILRDLRKKAHSYFDRFYKEKLIDQIYKKKSDLSRRNKSYLWLSLQLNLPLNETHIGMFDEDRCKDVIRICSDKINQLNSSVG